MQKLKWKINFGEAAMFKINRILIFFACMLVAGCKTANIPEAYNFKPKEVRSNPFGCWMEVSVAQSEFSNENFFFAGELLAMELDSAFLLVTDGQVKTIANNSILSASLYTHQNQAGTYLGLTGLHLIPNFLGLIFYLSEYGGGFLALGIPVSVVGLIQTAKNGNFQKNVLEYPHKNALDQFIPFSRFPAGMPHETKVGSLVLKKIEK